jgi:hypothetical protein
MLWAQKLLGRMGRYGEFENCHCTNCTKCFFERSMCSKARHMSRYVCAQRKRHITMGCDEIVLSGDAHTPIVPIHCWPKLERPSWSSLRSKVGSAKSYKFLHSVIYMGNLHRQCRYF